MATCHQDKTCDDDNINAQEDEYDFNSFSNVGLTLSERTTTVSEQCCKQSYLKEDLSRAKELFLTIYSNF
ncbi:hypothetical protein GcM3_183050 [Golovinomyces cichoracearum]|uniref:Uncharacterized protein n=1 Tax=Golovinomyces cichoracearum TaxID=62708 RepID=A0A420HL41_9PEZI|nr:hypothetical protein GcM3_183050 [Golovinomyces cichoracearum]